MKARIRSDIFWRKQKLEYSESSQAWVSELKVRRRYERRRVSRGALHADAGSEQQKDTMTGHWEMMGIKTEKPFRTFTEHGFPAELIKELEKQCGKKVIGNKSASGTEIIEELGEEEIRTGSMIVYTSADSVMQICGNEETFDLEELYRCCETARRITMKDECA